jgi:UDP-N-acetylmuramyl pentapeptide phosphotransferase/UDP-N-acetylglucosamine-1-phosphate transferase
LLGTAAVPRVPYDRRERPALSDSWSSPFVVAGVALALALALTPALRALARRFGLLDRPNPRSSHAGVVPRAGGAAIAVSVLAATALAPAAWRGPSAVVLAGALLLGAIGLVDDRFGLPATARIAAQLAVAALLVGALGGLERVPLPAPLDVALGPMGAPLAALWVVAVVNFFNFLDGIDGLAALQAAVTAAGVAIASFDAGAVLVAAALGGAALGFLPFNWSPASVFLGDVGSYFIGCALAALPLTAPHDARPGAVLLVALSLWLFLADASLTLGRRALRGERVWEAHREHLYQHLARRFGHARVTLALGAGSALVTATALLAAQGELAAGAWAVVALALLLFGSEWAAARWSTA